MVTRGTRVKNGLDPDSNAQYIGLVPQNRHHEQQFYKRVYWSWIERLHFSLNEINYSVERKYRLE